MEFEVCFHFGLEGAGLHHRHTYTACLLPSCGHDSVIRPGDVTRNYGAAAAEVMTMGTCLSCISLQLLLILVVLLLVMSVLIHICVVLAKYGIGEALGLGVLWRTCLRPGTQSDTEEDGSATKQKVWGTEGLWAYPESVCLYRYYSANIRALAPSCWFQVWTVCRHWLTIESNSAT